MPRIRDGGWLRSLERRLDDLEAEGPVGIPWDEVLSRIRWYRRGRGLLVAVGWGFAQAIASRSSSSACFTKGHRLGAIGCAGGAPGHASAWGPGSGRTRAQRCQSSRSIRPRLRNLCAHWGGKSFPRSPRARVRSTNTGVLRRGPGAPRSSPYGTSGRHWDLTETFLTPLRLQG